MLYVLAATVEKYTQRIDLHEVLFMSNHAHMVLTDREGCLPAFMRELNSVLACQLNALRGTSGTNIEKGYNSVSVQDDDSMFRHIVYTLANPCSAHIVERTRDWKGVHSNGLEYGVVYDVARPTRGLWSPKCAHRKRAKSIASKRARFGGRSRMPARAGLILVRPDIRPDLDDRELRQQIRETLEEREDELIESRQRPVMGMVAALKMNFLAIPGHEERFGMTPSFSASTKKRRVTAARERRAFIDEYREALMKFVAGVRDVVFPAGTWLMARRFEVRVAADTG